MGQINKNNFVYVIQKLTIYPVKMDRKKREQPIKK